MKRTLTAAIALAIAIAIPLTLWAQAGGNGRLRGRVTDRNGDPVQGVRITAENNQTGHLVRALTNPSGEYTLRRLGDGIYRIDFTKDGYSPLEISRQIRSTFTNPDLNVTIESLEPATEEPSFGIEAYNRGVELLRGGSFEEALPLFLGFLQENPSMYQVWLNVGICYGGLERYEEALESFNRVLETEPDNTNAIFLIANTCLNMQDTVSAERYYEMLVERVADDPEHWYTLGELYNYNEKREQALEAFRRAVELRDDYADAILKLGATLLALEEREQGVQHIERFLELAPDSPMAASARTMAAQAHRFLGEDLMEAVRYQEAIAHLERCLELAPDIEDADEIRAMTEAARQELETPQQ